MAVCVAMAAGCCSDVVETLQPHTAPNVPALPLAGRNHMGTQQPIGWEEHFVWIESLSALRTKEERERDAVMENARWRFLVPPPPLKKAIFCYSHLLNTVLKEKGWRGVVKYKDSLSSSVPPSIIYYRNILTAVMSQNMEAPSYNSPLTHSW